jgi:hypothetical protein
LNRVQALRTSERGTATEGTVGGVRTGQSSAQRRSGSRRAGRKRSMRWAQSSGPVQKWLGDGLGVMQGTADGDNLEQRDGLDAEPATMSM